MHKAMKEIRSRRDEGFTLIELLVVIVVLGILAAVVVFAVGGITDRGKSSSCDTEVATVQTAVESYNAQKGDYPTATGVADLGSKLQAAGFLSENVDLPGATADYSPAWNNTTHQFTASCPDAG